VGHTSCVGKVRNSCIILIGKPRYGWENNTKMYHREIVCKLDSAGSGQCPILGFCEYGNE
jgi:hypothetical protein